MTSQGETLAKNSVLGEKPDNAALREDFYNRASTENLAPLWTVLAGMVPREPTTRAVPTLWPYDRVRPYLLEATDLIGTVEAERRVLILENPALPHEAKITGSMYAGLQVILPGERAHAHRHAAAALRFVMEGTGGWTAVNNEKTEMHPGDFVVTPSWTWHEHGNDGNGPVVWLDGLDIHIVNLLDTGFREDNHEQPHLAERPFEASMFEAGMNLLPMDADRTRHTSPIFNYTYAKSREALHGASRFRDIDPARGFMMRYVNPLNGDWAMATVATWLQLLPKGNATAPYRSTDGTIMVVVEGRGHSVVAGKRIDWKPQDVFAIPAWSEVTHHPDEETVMFGASDRATQEKLGLWRERR